MKRRSRFREITGHIGAKYAADRGSEQRGNRRSGAGAGAAPGALSNEVRGLSGAGIAKADAYRDDRRRPSKCPGRWIRSADRSDKGGGDTGGGALGQRGGIF